MGFIRILQFANEVTPMTNGQVSIGQVKRDISELVNRVAFGGERVLLTSRGKPKAALVSIEDYLRLTQDGEQRSQTRIERWLAAGDQLAEQILQQRGQTPVDADAILAAARADQEERHDFLRGD